MRTTRLGWPSRLNTPGSVTPGTSDISAFTALDNRSSSARSRPKILTEFSPFTPETASSTLSWMYCEKLKSTPTKSSEQSREFSRPEQGESTDAEPPRRRRLQLGPKNRRVSDLVLPRCLMTG